MKSLSRLIGLLLASVLYLTGTSFFAQPKNIPAYTGHVNDFANVIDPTTKQQLETILLNFENKTGAQIAVVTVNSLEGRSKQDYAIDLFRQWGIGAKSGDKRDKGLLILVAVQDKQSWIEVGYGLEGDLPDGLVGEIARRMTPYFKQGDWSKGFMEGVQTVVATLAQKWGVSIENIDQNRAYRGSDSPELSGKGLGVLLAFFIGFIILMMFIARSSRRRGSVAGHAAGDAIWWLAPLIFNRGGGNFGGGSSSSSGWGDSGGSSGGSDWGGFGGGASGGGGAGDSW